MTSPVDTSVKYFTSAMNLPNSLLTNAAGLLLPIIQACVDGFDSKSATIVVSGGVATVSWSGSHSCLPDTVIEVAGVTGGMTNATDMNGEQKVVSKASTSCTFACPTVSNGTATGTITIKMAGLGYQTQFTGTNKAVYKLIHPASTGFALRFDDTNALYMRVRGGESFTDVDTHVNPFPTDAMISGGGYMPKTNAAMATAVPWEIIGDARGFFLCIPVLLSSSSTYLLRTVTYFGDLTFTAAGDAAACVVAAGNSTSGSTSQAQIDLTLSVSYATYNNYAVARSYTQLAGSIMLGRFGAHTWFNTSVFSGSANTMTKVPNANDGVLPLVPLIAVENTAAGLLNRARFPGIQHIEGDIGYGYNTGDTFTGSGPFTGKKLYVVRGGNTGAPGGSGGTVLIDVTGPWR
ncbi:MAG: hypothetical protein JSS14_21870 [Proteobacteria bacterium]|nr:hypothetical protein [Pseudomonadota bacterium]